MSWFWLVGAVVLSLLPPLVKTTLGGAEETVTAYLAIFSIAVAVGSGLAAWLAHGRIVLLPTLIGAVLLGVFSLDLGWAAFGVEPAIATARLGDVFSSVLGYRIAVDLAGLAIAGGLFIVPSFAAMQAWAGADRRARVIAAVNVINAAFMVGGALIFAVLQTLGLDIPRLFLVIGAACLAVAAVIARTMPTRPSTTLCRSFFAPFSARGEGAENFTKAGPNAIIALNHVSFLDAALALSLIRHRPRFRDRLRDREEMVGAAVPAFHPRDADRSDQADGDAHVDQCGEERRDAHHLPGRTADRHRQPDEGL